MFGRMGKQAAMVARGGIKVTRLVGQCQKLLTERGQAGSLSLSREALALCGELDRRQQAAFFQFLLEDFSPDPAEVLEAARQYADQPNAERLARLNAAAEAPRQELLRRLNRVPGGTAAILRMREQLLHCVREQPALAGLDWDFRHLLASWFNPGFLQIVRADWRSPAYLLEKVIAHEAVHEIQGWGDLRRRLESDRRCFAFFHPALPDEPLIFVEVALTDEMPSAIAPLLDTRTTPRDASRATVAALYSISNCQPGLRGVSLGNFLIKQVVDLLSAEFPRIRRFCTLSPIPGFSRWLSSLARTPEAEYPAALAAALRDVVRGIGADPAGIAADPAAAWDRLKPVEEPLKALCAAFLLSPGAEAEPALDPVARFHLNNGARLERLNWAADQSKQGLRQSLGIMANYVYDPGAIEANHDRFVHGRLAVSRQVASLVPRE